VQRGWWNLGLELAGAALIAWAWRLFGLADPERRKDFVATGRLTQST